MYYHRIHRSGSPVSRVRGRQGSCLEFLMDSIPTRLSIVWYLRRADTLYIHAIVGGDRAQREKRRKPAYRSRFRRSKRQRHFAPNVALALATGELLSARVPVDTPRRLSASLLYWQCIHETFRTCRSGKEKEKEAKCTSTSWLSKNKMKKGTAATAAITIAKHIHRRAEKSARPLAKRFLCDRTTLFCAFLENYPLIVPGATPHCCVRGRTVCLETISCVFLGLPLASSGNTRNTGNNLPGTTF